MLRRNGGMPKVIVGVVAFFGLVYFIYLYNDLSGQLKNTQHSAERYRREQESVSAQLQDQILAKDELKQRCDHDKEQMTNRLNSQQQQYKMLKSQHEDMESEFGRLQNEKTVAEEEHKKQDDERAIEYNQFKQEKSLEITSLKDNIANLEREKGQLTQQIAELKSQLQNSVKQLQADRLTIQRNQGLLNYAQDLVQQAHARQQQLENQYQLLLQQQPQQGNRQQQQQFQGNQQQLPQGNQQQQQVIGKQGTSFEGFGQLAGGNNLQGGNVQPVGNWQQHGNLQDSGVNQQQALNHGGGFLPENMHQNIQGALQGLKQQFPNNDDTLGKIVHGLGNLHENLLQGQHGGQTVQQNTKSGNQDNFNLVDDILKSVQDKHKPVDAALLEEQQKQHQIIPPGDHDSEKNLGYQRQAQNVLGQDGHGIQQQQIPHQQEVHQVVKPNFEDNNQDDKDAHHGNNDDDLDTGAADGNHDNRIENQGPVNLQVQEPNLHHDVDKAKLPMKDDELRFRPHVPNPVDNQIQPQHVDDSQRQEQIDLPIKREEIQDEEEHIAGRNAEDDDDEDNYDDEYDKAKDNKADEY